MVRKFITYDMWHMTGEGVSSSIRLLVTTLKAIVLSVRFFLGDRLLERASALTYYTLLAIVPVLALMIGIAKGFGVQELVEQSLANVSAGQSDTLTYLLSFADNYLQQANSGIIMGIGIVMLLWVIFSTIGNIEKVFNDIWQVKQGRSFRKKVSDYLSIMIITPLFLILVCGLQIFSHTILKSGELNIVFSTSLAMALKIMPFLLIIILFTLTYMVIPNAKVKFSNALIAGAVAGSVFLIFQNLYISGQIWVSKYSAIYGSVAALPLLILWIQASWSICLFGAQLSFACQNASSFNFESDTKNISPEYRQFLNCVVCSYIYSQFPKKFNTEQIAQKLRLPSRLANQIIQDLSDINAISETPDKSKHADGILWTVGKPTDTYTFGQLIADIQQMGSADFGIDHKEKFALHWDLYTRMAASSKEIGDTHLLRDFKIDFDKLDPKCNTSHSTK